MRGGGSGKTSRDGTHTTAKEETEMEQKDAVLPETGETEAAAELEPGMEEAAEASEPEEAVHVEWAGFI